MSDFEKHDAKGHREQTGREAVEERSALEVLSPEVLGLILEFLPAKTLLHLSETSRKLRSECIGNSALWKGLLKVNFIFFAFTVRYLGRS